MHTLFSASAVDPELELEPATLTGSRAIVAQCRARGHQGSLEYVDDRGVQPREGAAHPGVEKSMELTYFPLRLTFNLDIDVNWAVHAMDELAKYS